MIRVVLVLVAATLGGCHLAAPAPEAPRVYDLAGIPATEGTLLQVLDLSVHGAPELRTRQMFYRMASEPGELKSYASHLWAAPPAQMLERRLRLLTGRVTGRALSLELEVLLFEQYLAEDSAEARLAVEAVARDDSSLCGREQFSLAAPMARRDAPAGALAFSEASLELARRLSSWLAELRCAAGS